MADTLATRPLSLEPALLFTADPDVAWARLAQLHARSTGQPGQLPPEIARLTADQAFAAYGNGVTAALGQLSVLDTGGANQMLGSLTDHVEQAGSLAGVTGVFFSAATAAGRDGGTTELDRAAQALDRVGLPDVLDGGVQHIAMYHAPTAQPAMPNRQQLEDGLRAAGISGASGAVFGTTGEQLARGAGEIFDKFASAGSGGGGGLFDDLAKLGKVIAEVAVVIAAGAVGTVLAGPGVGVVAAATTAVALERAVNDAEKKGDQQVGADQKGNAGTTRALGKGQKVATGATSGAGTTPTTGDGRDRTDPTRTDREQRTDREEQTNRQEQTNRSQQTNRPEETDRSPQTNRPTDSSRSTDEEPDGHPTDGDETRSPLPDDQATPERPTIESDLSLPADWLGGGSPGLVWLPAAAPDGAALDSLVEYRADEQIPVLTGLPTLDADGLPDASGLLKPVISEIRSRGPRPVRYRRYPERADRAGL